MRYKRMVACRCFSCISEGDEAVEAKHLKDDCRNHCFVEYLQNGVPIIALLFTVRNREDMLEYSEISKLERGVVCLLKQHELGWEVDSSFSEEEDRSERQASEDRFGLVSWVNRTRLK